MGTAFCGKHFSVELIFPYLIWQGRWSATAVSDLVVLLENNIYVDMQDVCFGSTYKAYQIPE